MSDAEAPGRGARWLVVIGALCLSLLAAWVAPSPWPAGAAQLLVTQQGVRLLQAPVALGASPAQQLAGSGITIALPQRSGPGERVALTLALEPQRSDAPVRIELILADGRRQLVPVVRQLDDGRRLAARQPLTEPGVMLALLVLVVVLWVSEALPLFITSLIVPIVLVGARIADAQAALAPFFHPIIALFLGGFLMAIAVRQVGLDRLAAIAIIHWLGRSPARLFAAVLVIAAFLSMWMSNTAAVAVLIPVALAISEPLDDEAYRKTLVLGLAYAATIGGVGSAIGTPANPIAIAFLDAYAGRTVSFAQWSGFGLPMVVAFLPLMGVYLWWAQGVQLDEARFVEARRIAEAQWRGLGPLSADQWRVLGVMVLVVVGWLTEQWHGLNTGIVALAGVVALAAVGAVGGQDLRSISWESLLTFGGGIALGTFLTQTGASDWVATSMEGLAGVPAPVAITLVALLALALTTVASNTASAAVLVPLAIPLAAVLGVDPVVLVVVVAIASSVDFALVIGTPPTLMAYSTRLFTAGEIFRIGAALDLLGILLLVTIVVSAWRLLGLV